MSYERDAVAVIMRETSHRESLNLKSQLPVVVEMCRSAGQQVTVAKLVTNKINGVHKAALQMESNITY